MFVLCRRNPVNLAESLGDELAMKSTVIESDPAIMGGTPVFKGTRVPMQTLMDYLEGGQSISEFLDGFPTVTEQQVVEFLEEAKECFLAEA